MGCLAGKPHGRITIPRIKRAIEMRERGMSYPAISAAMDVYEGNAPTAHTLSKYVRAAGLPSKPRGRSFG